MVDAELVRRLQAGEMDAFAEIYNRYHAKIYQIVLRKASFNRELSEDITAETFAKAHRSINTFTGSRRGGVPAWLATIARNLLVDHWTAASTRHDQLFDEDGWAFVETRVSQAVPATEDTVVDGMTRTNNIANLLQALGQLTELQHHCITHRFFNEKSVRETAEIMGKSESNVKQLQLDALRKLSRLMARRV
jgi:RNA polymerase sigma-70 factor (ECF subfamily)